MGNRERRDPAELLPLTPQAFHILLALAGGEMHGYGIMQAVAERSDGAVRLGPGTLYGAIRRMLEQGVLEETSGPRGAKEDERRRYYRLTPFGRRVLSAEADRLEALVRSVRAQRVRPRARPS